MEEGWKWKAVCNKVPNSHALNSAYGGNLTCSKILMSIWVPVDAPEKMLDERQSRTWTDAAFWTNIRSKSTLFAQACKTYPNTYHTYGTHWNHKSMTIPLSIQNICFGAKITKKYLQFSLYLDLIGKLMYKYRAKILALTLSMQISEDDILKYFSYFS